MKQLIQAILAVWALNNAAAVVSPPSPAGPLFGLAGPFWDTAPEKTKFPYCILQQTTAPKPIYGFSGGIYEEYVSVQFVVKCSDGANGGLLDAAGFADAIAGVYDMNRAALTGQMSGESTKLARRIAAAMLKKEPNYGPDGVAVYSATVTYEYAIERTL